MSNSDPDQVVIHVTSPNDDRHKPCYGRHFTHKSRSKILCAALLSLLVVAGLIASILWLSLNPHRPQVSVTDFRVQGLGQLNGSTDAVVTYHIGIHNPNPKIQIHYNYSFGRLFYQSQDIGGAPVLTKPFDQARKNTTTLAGSLRGVTLPADSRLWPELRRDQAAGTVAVKLQLWSVIKFKAYAWDTQWHNLRADCELAVGPKGVILGHHKRCCVFSTLKDV